jgi:hypothetical protein
MTDYLLIEGSYWLARVLVIGGALYGLTLLWREWRRRR